MAIWKQIIIVHYFLAIFLRNYILCRLFNIISLPLKKFSVTQQKNHCAVNSGIFIIGPKWNMALKYTQIGYWFLSQEAGRITRQVAQRAISHKHHNAVVVDVKKCDLRALFPQHKKHLQKSRHVFSSKEHQLSRFIAVCAHEKCTLVRLPGCESSHKKQNNFQTYRVQELHEFADEINIVCAYHLKKIRIYCRLQNLTKI
jgi:hypothetical protein